MKRQAKDTEETYAVHTSEKGPMSRKYKELLPLNNKKINNPMKIWAKDLKEMSVTQEDVQMANKYMKKCSASTLIRDLWLKPQDNTTQLPVWLKLATAAPSVGQGVEQAELSHIAGGNSKWCSHFEKQFL